MFLPLYMPKSESLLSLFAQLLCFKERPRVNRRRERFILFHEGITLLLKKNKRIAWITDDEFPTLPTADGNYIPQCQLLEMNCAKKIQGWEFAQVAHQKWAMWANRSGLSPKMRDVSESLRSLTKNERMNKWLVFLSESLISSFLCAKNDWIAQKTDERIPSPEKILIL